MSIDTQVLQQVVVDVCSGMLGLTVEPSPGISTDESEALSAVIRVSGEWESLIQVLAPMATARTIASNMFATEEAELTESEIRDAFGEIANMVGGNLKGIVDRETSLSLPCVGPADGCSPFGGEFAGISVVNLCGGDALVVRMLDRSHAPDDFPAEMPVQG